MTNLFKQTTVYALLFIGLLFNACVKDISDQFDKPDKTDPDDSQESTSGIPDDFDYSTTSTINLSVKVVDQYQGKYNYTVEVYDQNPVLEESATLLTGGKTNSKKPFQREIVVSKTSEALFILQTDPFKRKSLYLFDIEEGNMVCDLGKISTTKSDISTFDNDADKVDFSMNEEELIPIQGKSFEIEGDKKYIIKDKFEGELREAGSSGSVIYVKDEWTLKQKLANFYGVKVYVLKGGKIKADDKKGYNLYLKGPSLLAIEKGGEVEDIDMWLSGEARVVNEGEVEINNLKMEASATIINFCVFEVEKELRANDGNASIILKHHSMVECEKMHVKNIKVRMDVGSIFKVKDNAHFGGGNHFEGPAIPNAGDADFALFRAGKVTADVKGVTFTNCVESYVIDYPSNEHLFEWVRPARMAIGKPNVEIDDDDCNRFSGNHNPGEGEGDTDDNYNEEASATPTYTYMFEDNWPAFGDYDMNDLVMDVNIANSISGANAASVTITTTVHAVGATKALYAFARIEAPGAGNKVVQLFGQEAHAFMQGTVKETINTHKYTHAPQTNSITVTLPASTQGVVNVNNLNVFLVWGDISGDKWNEVHLPGFGGTDKAAQASSSNGYKYKVDGSENSNPAYGNMMWALKIPTKYFKSYPREGISINEAYSGFEKWAQTGGSSNYDWYTNPSDESKLFQRE